MFTRNTWYAQEESSYLLVGAEANVRRRSQANVGIAILVAIVFIGVISAVMLIPTVVSTFRPVPKANTDLAATPTSTVALEKARAILARVRDEVIPRDGVVTDYGVSFSEVGYTTLIQWNEEVKVDARYADAFESLDLRLPCCDWAQPSRDEKANCACGHHQALEGLAKKLLADERPGAVVQVEVSRWARYMYPKEALAAEMEKRAQLDPEIKAALEELKARGEC
jgi:hypothetical protein